MRRRLFLWTLLVTAIVLAALYLQCGRGWGLGGGKGKGSGPGSGPGSALPARSTIDAGPSRCAVRIAANGITVDGNVVTVAEAVAACRSAEGADVVVTGGARRRDRDDLKAAFQRARIDSVWSEPQVGDGVGSGS